MKSKTCASGLMPPAARDETQAMGIIVQLSRALRQALLAGACVLGLATLALAQTRLVRKAPAPELSASTWLVGERGVPTIAGHHGRTMLIYTLDWADEERCAEILPRVNDLVRANADLDLGCVGFVPVSAPVEPDVARARMKQFGIEHAIGLVATGPDSKRVPHAYIPSNRGFIASAFLVGPSGELVWQGDLTGAWRDFYAHLLDSYRRLPLPPLETECTGKLAAACAAYYNGRLSVADDMAAAIEDESLREQIDSLRAKIAQVRSTSLVALRASAASGDTFAYASLERNIKRMGGDKELGLELRKLSRGLRSQPGGRRALQAAEEWFEMTGWRPPLFPERRDRDGDRFVGKVRTLLEKAGPKSSLYRVAHPLVERYEHARP